MTGNDMQAITRTPTLLQDPIRAAIIGHDLWIPSVQHLHVKGTVS